MFGKLAFAAAAFVVGGGLAVQSIVNAGLARAVGSSALAAAVSFWVGGVVLTVACFSTMNVPAALASARGLGFGWWIGGGLLGMVFVTTLVAAVPRIGVASTMAFVIAGQLLGAALLDHFGVLGIETHPLTAARMAGVALLIGGALLVRFF